ncbi:MAG: hypothetical protein Q4A31_08160 [Corynebacterium sp.]|uniref:hypothetical protein n=1 Tax=Corynebacterium sp. TaxID=1720 RepID=UPI0026DCBD8D|nr:hypothetical protein [Corynebacterium sp.]MDO4761874.1 hypothetical protein [Corynebacterium sp.]
MKKLSGFVSAIAVVSTLTFAPSASAVELKIGPEFDAETRALILDNAQKIEKEAKERAEKQAAGEYDRSPHHLFSAPQLLAINISTVEEMWECWKDYPRNRHNPFLHREGAIVPPMADFYAPCPLVPITEKDREMARKEVLESSAVKSSPGLVIGIITFIWKAIEALKKLLFRK